MSREIQAADKEFYQWLKNWLAKSSEGNEPIVPLKFNADGSINRMGTLEFPCYSGMEVETAI